MRIWNAFICLRLLHCLYSLFYSDCICCLWTVFIQLFVTHPFQTLTSQESGAFCGSVSCPRTFPHVEELGIDLLSHSHSPSFCCLCFFTLKLTKQQNVAPVCGFIKSSGIRGVTCNTTASASCLAGSTFYTHINEAVWLPLVLPWTQNNNGLCHRPCWNTFSSLDSLISGPALTHCPPDQLSEALLIYFPDGLTFPNFLLDLTCPFGNQNRCQVPANNNTNLFVSVCLHTAVECVHLKIWALLLTREKQKKESELCWVYNLLEITVLIKSNRILINYYLETIFSI